MTSKSFFKSSGHLIDSKIDTEAGGILDLKKLPAFLRTLLEV